MHDDAKIPVAVKSTDANRDGNNATKQQWGDIPFISHVCCNLPYSLNAPLRCTVGEMTVFAPD
jgi:hypothetical protein